MVDIEGAVEQTLRGVDGLQPDPAALLARVHAGRRLRHRQAWVGAGAITATAVTGVALVATIGSTSNNLTDRLSSPATHTSTSTAGDNRCRAVNVKVAAQWEPGVVPYGADPAHRNSAAELFGQITIVNDGPACTLTGYPQLQLVGSTGAPLAVPIVYGGQGCRLACGGIAGAPIVLRRGQVSAVGIDWQPSYCGPNPGTHPQLVVTIGKYESQIAKIRNLGSPRSPIYAPSCVRTLPPSRLIVEPYGPAHDPATG